jgi:hypothetical protein
LDIIDKLDVTSIYGTGSEWILGYSYRISSLPDILIQSLF